MFGKSSSNKQRTRTLLAAALLTAVCAVTVPAMVDTDPVGTTFTYQGRLLEAGEPVSGTVDLHFRMYDHPDGGNVLGDLVAFDFEIGDDGRFTIDLDFGDVFDGGPRWLEIHVNATPLSPRQPIMAAPHAMVATTAANVPTKAVVGNYAGITGVGTLDSLNVAGNIFSSTNGIPIRGVRDATSGTFPGVWGETNSGASGSSSASSGVRGYANHTAPGANVAGVWGHSFSETDNGIGVHGSHESDGIGIKGESNGGFGGYFVGDGYFSGNLGIGTTNPQHILDVVGIAGRISSPPLLLAGPRLELKRSTHTTLQSTMIGAVEFFDSDDEYGGGISYTRTLFGDRLWLSSGGEAHLAIDGDGRVGIGTSIPNVRLHLDGGTNAQLNSGGYLTLGAMNSTNIVLDSNEIMARDSGQTANLHLNKFGGEVHVGYFSNGAGRFVTPVLQITGGSDLAERFDIADIADTTPQPGMVVCIDPHNPGKLIPSTRAYDRTVAGVISGANGINSGMIMGQEGTEADGAHPVALTGRVYVMVDAGANAVEPGDMLTTSDVPGHAMPVDDYARMHGAVIGKAMTHLDKGERGMVLVLVNLQ